MMCEFVFIFIGIGIVTCGALAGIAVVISNVTGDDEEQQYLFMFVTTLSFCCMVVIPRGNQVLICQEKEIFISSIQFPLFRWIRSLYSKKTRDRRKRDELYVRALLASYTLDPAGFGLGFGIGGYGAVPPGGYENANNIQCAP
ncbi:unnamed protein product [Amoebophrya sp. A120]|nr:unnamed protein product [Amoebophrya sp. A120]|eukprot:GSA120T00018574001.1